MISLYERDGVANNGFTMSNKIAKVHNLVDRNSFFCVGNHEMTPYSLGGKAKSIWKNAYSSEQESNSRTLESNSWKTFVVFNSFK